MMKYVLVFAVATSFACSGCTPASSIRETFSSLKASSEDYRDTTDESDPQWDAVGREARGDRPLESENDPFRFLMSEKARSIERSVGIGD